MKFVIATARRGSYQGAASDLETDPSTVGRRIQRLEQILGTKIFDRHASGMQLTPAGQMLFEKAVSMERLAHEIEASLTGLDSRVTGTVRISVTEGLGSLWLVPALADFCTFHSEIDVQIVPDRQGVNLLSREADVSILIERPSDPRLVISKAAKVDHLLFMAKSYEERVGRRWDDGCLRDNRLVDYAPYHISAGMAWWSDLVKSGHRLALQTGSASIYLSSIRAGLGIGILPHFYRHSAPDLTVLPIDTGCSLTLWLASHEETNKAHRTRLLLDFLKDRFKRDRTSWFD